MALMVDGSIACDDDVPTTLRYMYEHNIHVDALPSVFTTYMELEQAGFHSDDLGSASSLLSRACIKLKWLMPSKLRCMVKATLPIKTNTAVVEDRKPIQRVDDVQGKDGGAHA